MTSCASKEKQSSQPEVKTSLPTTIEQAVESSYRTPANKERDRYRHPVETLKFFGLKPEMTVVEVAPGAGWYMEILAPLLAAKGHYIAASPPSTPENTYMAEMNAKVSAWLKSHPELERSVQFTTFSPPKAFEIAAPNSVDMVVTFRNVHNWMKTGSSKRAFDAFFKVLKPGGILGVVEHRLDPNAKYDPKATSGYVSEKHIRDLAERAGFVFQEKSEINANLKDTKDYADGVWTLPPTLRKGDEDREKYLAIGESDRMTMRFIKPPGKMPKKLPKKLKRN